MDRDERGHAVPELGRPDEGAAGAVLLIARLLADEHEASGSPLAEDSLGRVLVERAPRAARRLAAKLRQ